jgi:hypothetical protein
VEHVVKDELNDILERVAERVEELRDGKEGEKDTLNDDTGRLKSPDTRNVYCHQTLRRIQAQVHVNISSD